jgi:hypothetical protein
MNIREINKPVTAASLNESLAKRFGKKINLEAFSLEQLEDARNKLRTTLSQYETNESFDSVHDAQYQKNKLFLDVLNQAVIEAEADVDEETRDEKKARFKQKRADKRIGDKISKDAEITSPAMQNKKSAKDSLMKMIKKEDKMPDKNKDGVPDYAQDGKGKNDLGKNAKPKQKKAKDLSKVPPQLRKHMKKDEGKEIINNYFQTLLEGEEDKAEIVMASKDMVDRVTGWMEDTAEMQAESMLELGDAIRDEMGQAQSETFIGTVKPALESLYTALEGTRAALTAGVAQLTGEGGGEVPMGGEDEMPVEEPAPDAEMEPTVDAEAEAAEDEFAAAEPAAGGEAEAGREKRESKIAKKKMIETSRRLGTILSTKK